MEATEQKTNGQARSRPRVKDRVAKDLVKLFKLLSDETRLRILFALMEEKEMHVRALCELLEQVVVQHDLNRYHVLWSILHNKLHSQINAD